MSASVTVGIPTYLRDKVLVDTIRQVLEQDPAPDSILVVDQTPSHDAETEAFLRDRHDRGLIRHLHQEEPSLTGARNRILAESTSEVVIFIDDDVELPPGFVAAHASNYSDEEVNVVAGAFLLKQNLERHFRELKAQPGVRPADSSEDVRGGNHSVRRTAAIAAGGYDENFIGPAQGEENDFSLRLRKICGGKQIYDPKSWLCHLRVPTGGCRIAGNLAWEEWQKTSNIWLFGFRHHWPHSLVFVERAFRSGPRRKENILRPWRQPMAWAGFIYAAFSAMRKVGHTRSPFTASQGSSAS